jgi:phosphate transport system permease protein
MNQDPAPGLSGRRRTAAVFFDQPLLFTSRENLRGFLLNALGRFLLLGVGATSVVAVFLIFFFIFREGALFFSGEEAAHGAASGLWARMGELLGGTRWYPEADAPEYGAGAIVLGSIYVTFGSLLLAVPMGLLAAICLSDIVPFRVRQVVKPVVELLAAIPSVAYGFFAILVLAPWMQEHFHLSTGANALNASIMLAIMAIPTIVSVSEDSLSALGRELREASYALGATRAETLLRVIMPAARNGIFAAIILGMMRAIGETMVVWMASGNAAQVPAPWWNLTVSVRTLTATVAGEMGETVKGSMHYHSLFALGLVLLLFTFLLNLVSEFFLRRAKRAEGKSQ